MCQKWRENNFWEPVDSADTLRSKLSSKSLSHRYQDKCVFAFYAEIQDGRQKRRENDFGEKSPVDSADTLWVKYFVESTLSRTVIETNEFLHFMQKFKMVAKNGGKTIALYLAPLSKQMSFCILCRNSRWLPKMAGKQFWGKVASTLYRYPVGQKFCRNHSISYCFRDKCVFAFYAVIQDGCQWENDLGKKSPVD